MKKKFAVLGLTLALTGLVGITNANADVLVDRGLPTANLNNAAGADRSNVAWVFTGYSAADYWLVGDTFQNTSSNTWNISSIRLWSTAPASTAALWGGVDGSAISLVSTSGAITSGIKYANGENYQGYSGSYRDIYQLDFAVNVTLAAGQTYDFFLDGTGASYTVPFAHASNAALSGSAMKDADDSMLSGEVVDGVFDSNGIETWSSLGNGWDRASDVNVQVIGAPVPEPETYAMLMAGLGLLGAVARRRKQKAA